GRRRHRHDLDRVTGLGLELLELGLEHLEVAAGGAGDDRDLGGEGRRGEQRRGCGEGKQSLTKLHFEPSLKRKTGGYPAGPLRGRRSGSFLPFKRPTGRIRSRDPKRFEGNHDGRRRNLSSSRREARQWRRSSGSGQIIL